jgi:hypothetical protein
MRRKTYNTGMQLGVYMHFKRKYYLVIGTAHHVDTEQEMVVYMPLYGDGRLWLVRPKAEFEEEVEPGVKRFRHVS